MTTHLQPEPASGGFDYASVPGDIANQMRTAADRVQQLRRAAVVDIGRELIAIKNRIEHGHFIEWVEHECQIPIRTAQRAMQAAEMVERNEKLSYLPADGLLTLASRAAKPISDFHTETHRPIQSSERNRPCSFKTRSRKPSLNLILFRIKPLYAGLDSPQETGRSHEDSTR